VSRRGQRSACVRMAVSAVAAYAFILQILFGSVVATRMAVAAPADALTMCAADSHDGGDPAGTPATRHAHAACLVCAFAAFAPPIPQASTIVAGNALNVFLVPDRPDSGRSIERHEPRSSRGPPRIA
jgi:hypothetical protein